MEGVEQEGDDIIVPAVILLTNRICSGNIGHYTSLGKGLDVDETAQPVSLQ